MKFSKGLFTLCIFGLLALPLMGVASAQNLLSNPGFETGDTTGWVVNGASAVSTVTVVSPENGPSFGGTHHAFMDNFSEAAIGLNIKSSTAAASATAGAAYYFVDLNLVQADAGGVLFVQVFAEQAGGGVIGGSGLLGPFFPALNTWIIISGSFTAPAATDFLTIQIEANTAPQVGSITRVKVDNAYLSQVGPPVATEDMSMGSIKALFR